MFMYTAKLTKKKIIIFVLLVAAVLCGLILLMPTEDAYSVLNEQMLEAEMVSITVSGIETNEDRIIFLNSKGLEVSDSEISTKTVQIPKEFNETYEQYNELQKSQGFDLEKFKGKTVDLYTYLVLNYDSEEEIHANVLIYKNKIIGGDVSSVNLDGFITGFDKT